MLVYICATGARVCHLRESERKVSNQFPVDRASLKYAFPGRFSAVVFGNN